MDLTDGALGAQDNELIDELLDIRQSIDNIDAALVHLLAERFKFTQRVGRLKAAGGLPASDPERERVQIQRLRSLAEESHLDPAFAEKFLGFIVAEVIHHHEQIASNTAAITTTPDA
ncbi:chorismate mutase [Glaciihabitans sp. dw_435]|uniref:chorismate mutase n=1 Tax=Glaciihabitans sp. dw_435 TaxID=2720081 RepID=UPI001BD2D5B9|nr:chorismate mutase [Glaciihabitans sp. dw_435]